MVRSTSYLGARQTKAVSRGEARPQVDAADVCCGRTEPYKDHHEGQASPR